MNSVFVWTFGDVVGLFICSVLVLVVAINSLSQWVKQLRCKHDGGVHETMACDAICNKCGKNLGFIGSWRKKST